jgi:hypothetical protein
MVIEAPPTSLLHKKIKYDGMDVRHRVPSDLFMGVHPLLGAGKSRDSDNPMFFRAYEEGHLVGNARDLGRVCASGQGPSGPFA